MIYSVCAQSTDAPATPAGLAILVEGTLPSVGIPGFGKNAIPCLMGVYRLESGLEVTARITREPLVFREGLWKDADGYSRAVREGAEGDAIVLVTESAAVIRRDSGGRGRWYYVISFDPGIPVSARADFMDSFAPKADGFISAASNPADISLPAVLRTGKKR